MSKYNWDEVKTQLTVVPIPKECPLSTSGDQLFGDILRDGSQEHQRSRTEK